MANQKPVIGISIGDPNGIGPEVIIKALDNPAMLEFCTPVVFGSSRLISFYKKILGSELAFIGTDDPAQIVNGKLNIVNLWDETPAPTPGQASEQGGRMAFSSLAAATAALKDGLTDALVTAPIDKKTIQNEDFHFPGHTEYLADRLGGEPLMFLVSERLKIAVATGHIALSEVSQHITAELLEKRIQQMELSLQRDFFVHKPRIAVLGLDPHNGDQGVIGTTDRDRIAPCIARLFAQGHYVFGPYAADGFFASGAYRRFDAVLAMYHDQGLIPFKTLAFEDGVNFTAGLPRVRTSPDHGTGYDIAGKGEADESSMRAALYQAIDILQNRTRYDHLTKNPLRARKTADAHATEDEDLDMSRIED